MDKEHELLAPAGNPEALDAAIAGGADAVYMGLKAFNARMRSSNFAYSQFEAACEALRGAGKKLYAAVNTVFEEREADRLYQLLSFIDRAGASGVIVQDLGTAALVKARFPRLRLHASTQMAVASARGANQLSRWGFSRVVLSRELSLEEIRAVRAGSGIEIEAFVHGSLCVSYSGLCLFSSYMGGKSANRGACTQACRRVYASAGTEGYFFSPDDLQLLDRVIPLRDAGVKSFKIEGRMKSAEYVHTVVAAYRRLLDGWDAEGEVALGEAREMLRGDFARDKTMFYIDGLRPAPFLRPDRPGGTGIPLGRVESVSTRGELRLGLVRGKRELAPQDSVRYHRADDSDRRTVKLSVADRGRDGTWIDCPEPFRQGDSVYLVQSRRDAARFKHVLPNSLARYRLAPGHENCPEPELPAVRPSDFEAFPEGVYAEFDKVADLYLAQAARPAGVFLHLEENPPSELEGAQKPLPFAPKDIIIVLDPFHPEGSDAETAARVAALLEKGYRRFQVNNVAQLGYFRGKEASLVAGPWLYVFNRQALSRLASEGIRHFTSPLENSRQNFLRVFEGPWAKGAFVTVRFRPSLFSMRLDTDKLPAEGSFEDKSGESFRIVARRRGSIVVPERPVALTDRIPSLKSHGVGRFILSFAGESPKKHEYKEAMAAALSGGRIEGAGKFNWKDGFWSEERDGAKD